MIQFPSRKSESRKFIDLLLQSTNNKWTNIEPSKEIKVGDFGIIERSTGEFLVEGNLYEHPHTKEAMQLCPVSEMAPTRFEKYTSQGVKELSPSIALAAGFEPIVQAGFEGRWQFGRHRGAMLLLHSPQIKRMKSVPSTTLLKDRQRRLLKDRVICTEVVTCPAFCLYLSNSQEHVFEVALNAMVPLPVAPGVSVGGGVAVGWRFGRTEGIVKDGADAHGNRVYFPLYSLKRLSKISPEKVKSVLRGAPETEASKVSIMDSIFEDPDVPWDDLDSDGEEIDFPEDSGEPLDDYEL